MLLIKKKIIVNNWKYLKLKWLTRNFDSLKLIKGIL